MAMEPFENAANLAEDVGLFEAATHAPPVELSVPELRIIHVALDGSNQDAAARGIAQALGERTGAAVHEQSGAATAADILSAAGGHAADLLVVPAPFGRDYALLKDESLGSVVDQLLLESTCPVLCVRDMLGAEAIDAALRRVLVPIATQEESAARALAWAFRVLPAGGALDLVAVADRDVLQEARRLMGAAVDPQAFAPEQVLRRLWGDIGSLVAAAQKRGTEGDQTVHVEARFGEFVPVVLAEAGAQPRLTVWGITRDHDAPAFHRAVDLLLESRGPVLMV